MQFLAVIFRVSQLSPFRGTTATLTTHTNGHFQQTNQQLYGGTLLGHLLNLMRVQPREHGQTFMWHAWAERKYFTAKLHTQFKLLQQNAMCCFQTPDFFEHVVGTATKRPRVKHLNLFTLHVIIVGPFGCHGKLKSHHRDGKFAIL